MLQHRDLLRGPGVRPPFGMVLHFLWLKRQGGGWVMGEKAQVLPSPLPVTPGLQQRRRTARGAGWPRWRRLWGAHGTVSFTIQPNLCDPGDAGDSAGSCGRSPVPQTPTGLRAQLCNQPFPGRGARHRQEPPARRAWPLPAGCFHQRFGTPPHPPRAPGHPGVSAEPRTVSLQPQGGLYL